MPNPAVHPPDLARALEAFPADAHLIRRLFLSNSAFRSVCEDYRLACEGLVAFGRLRVGDPRPEVEDYRRVVRELESEMWDMIQAAQGCA